MPGTWTTFRELLLPEVAAADRRRRGRALEDALRTAIRQGRLPQHTRLPSSRDLAGQLGLARGTVTTVYAQLVAEGYLTARHGSGTAVAAVAVAEDVAPVSGTATTRWRYDLRPGLPALNAFPRAEWLRAVRAGLGALTDEQLGYPDPAGLPALRSALAAYLARVRAVTTDAERIVITHGVAQAESLLADVLVARGHREIAVEDPHHPGTAELLAAHGLRPVPIPVDDDGIVVDRLAATGCRAVLVTPAHQFPLGVVLAPHRRRALLAWAADRDAVVIEDDYDAEHRYDRPAVRTVQTLDPESVAYVGSVSKVLSPALRLGWLVAPHHLLSSIVDRKRLTDLGNSPMTQAAFAHLLDTGGYDRHLRRTRVLYRQRRDALLAALAAELPRWQPVGVAAGLHVVVRLPEGTEDADVSERLAAQGVHALPLSGYATTSAPFPGLVLGYAALTPARLVEAVHEMAKYSSI
ncbi:PLP-dependent aminotransferase family protein [Labedaea rhizosphaerae]|uniref:GntR family transcriptional regulator n=1 Tax=Labedaea rhizosphaerae TaxID=598644 RepID=A0A4R6SLK8_LABRH|nr:PLP-dependent aminotransferase family protein [Labedaea rhizosphaerae]TDQ04192.1 GntR family transcriptional regulator [Labedaea rhizosphaerae]